jgi:cytoskeletal protein RodZ
MAEILLLDPANRDLLDKSKKRSLKFAIIPLILLLAFGLLLALQLAQFLKYTYPWKREHDEFIKNGQITEAIIDGCRETFDEQYRQIMFTYTLNTETIDTGSSLVRGTCEDYPVGSTIQVRYEASEPWAAKALTEVVFINSTFNYAILGMLQFLVWILYYGWRSWQELRLRNQGRVRQGHVLSIKRGRFGFPARLRYEVSSDDGSTVKGKQFVNAKLFHGEISPCTPLAVLYVDKRLHRAL